MTQGSQSLAVVMTVLGVTTLGRGRPWERDGGDATFDFDGRRAVGRRLRNRVKLDRLVSNSH